jgi:hypothetical protein
VSHISGLSPVAVEAAGLGHPLLDRYVVFLASRARANTVAATVSDLRVLFSVEDKDPRQVTASDVLDFIAVQRRPRADAVVRLADGEAGLSAQTIKRRLSSVLGLFSWLLTVGEVNANPVPRGLSTRPWGSSSPWRLAPCWPSAHAVTAPRPRRGPRSPGPRAPPRCASRPGCGLLACPGTTRCRPAG